MRTLVVAALVLLGTVLTGCALPRMIDSDVQSFTAAVPAVAPALYRFERLPSQGDSPARDQIEAMTAQALAKVGLTAATAPTARYTVQVSAHVAAMLSPYPQATLGGFWGFHGPRYRNGLELTLEPSWYRHTVRILLRDSRTGQLAYETSASFDGPWSDSARLLPAILDAALSGYPTPPSGPRKVVIELPGTPPQAP